MQKHAGYSQNSINQFFMFANQVDSPYGIEQAIRLLHKPPRYAALRQYLVYHRGNELKQELQATAIHKGYFFNVLNDSASVFEISRSPADEDNGIIAILPPQHGHIHRVITISYSRFWRDVQRIVTASYPHAMPVFFKQDEILAALQKFEASLGEKFSVRISEVTEKGKRSQRKRFDTNRMWTDMSIQEAFNEAAKRDQWFTSLKFIIKQRTSNNRQTYRDAGSGRIYKEGHISCDYFFSEFLNIFSNTLEFHAANRLKLLENRGILDNNYRPVTPLEIHYEDETFSTKDDIQRFGSLIRIYPHATKAVLHGNPYYHVSIADFKDGSSFELWVLTPSRILIVPQARSTAQAFERLISYIFTAFKEGDVREYEEARE